MSSQADSSLSTPEALLPMDDRLVVVSASEESSGHEFVDAQEAEPASATVGSSEDEVALCLNLLPNAEIETSGVRFLVSSEICLPTSNDRTCYPPRGYQCIYQDALEAGLRIPHDPFIVSLVNFF